MRETAELLNRVKSLFAELMDVSERERREHLGRIADEDPEAAALVRRLLSAHDGDDRFRSPLLAVDLLLEDDSPHRDRSTTAAGPMPDCGDRYRLARLLGCGSIGDVYLAHEQGPVAREVAIKVFRPGRAEAARNRRFAVEARALATLSHPGISQVHGAGVTGDGRPFLAMEFVAGTPIDEACVSAGLDHRGVLTLFIEVCNAVQHAHSRGIIHRDLKPNNILAIIGDGPPRIKVIDFGIAKLADEAGAVIGGATLDGQIVGTPDFMSPEQWRGETADTRADVYALGALLHLLLAGRTPPRAGGADGVAVRRRIELPELPRWIRRDAETVVATAMAFDPEARYASPRHLAEDLTRLLRREPLVARPATTIERVSKAIRRHPGRTVVTIVAVALSLAAVTYIAITRAALQDETETQRAMIVALIDDVIDRLFELSGPHETRWALASSLLANTDRLLASTPDDRSLLESRARLLVELGNVRAERGEPSVAFREQAVAAYEDLLARGEVQLMTARRHAEAIARLGHSIAAWPRGLDPVRRAARDEQFDRSLTIVADLVQRHPDDLGVLDDLCWCYDRIADARWSDGRRDELTDLVEERLALSEELYQRDPTRLLSSYNLMKAHWWTAQALLESNDAADRDVARGHLSRAIELGEHATAVDPNRRAFRQCFRRVLRLAARAAHADDDLVAAEFYFERVDEQSALLYRSHRDVRWVVIDTVRMQIEHAHAAMSFAPPDRVRRLHDEAVALVDLHPRSITGWEGRLLRETDAWLAAAEAPGEVE